MDHPDTVDRVVIFDSARIRYQVPGGEGIFHPTDGESLQRLADMLEPHGPRLPDYVRRDALRRLAKIQDITDKEMASMETGRDLLDDRLSTLQQPLLIVWGSDDLLLPVGVGEQMHRMVPRSELDIVEGCGHLAPKTCPSRVAAATADFLKANPAPSGGVRTLSNMH